MDSQSSASLSVRLLPPVFLTGAAGFVGANLVRRLLVDGVRVRVLLRPEDNNEALDGLDVVVATSCAVLGGNDFFPSQLGRTLCDFANRKLPAPRRRLGPVLIAAFALSGILMMPFGLLSSMWQAVCIAVVVGVLGGYIDVILTSWLQARTPQAMLGRVMSLSKDGPLSSYLQNRYRFYVLHGTVVRYDRWYCEHRVALGRGARPGYSGAGLLSEVPW